MSLIEVKELSKIYNEGKGNECRAIDGVSFNVDRGEFVAVVGKSGSGKTTLAHLLACIIEPTSGEITVDGISVNKLSNKQKAEYRNKTVGVVFQDYFLINELSALDNVTLPMFFKNKKTASERGNKLLKDVGLDNKTAEKISHLSGGEKQRVAIARALVNMPQILIADEPSGNLDSKNRDEIIEIFAQINAIGNTVIMVTHDDEVAKKCGRVITLEDGKIVGDTASDIASD